jgi:hypothetical protein
MSQSKRVGNSQIDMSLTPDIWAIIIKMIDPVDTLHLSQASKGTHAILTVQVVAELMIQKLGFAVAYAKASCFTAEDNWEELIVTDDLESRRIIMGIPRLYRTCSIMIEIAMKGRLFNELSEAFGETIKYTGNLEHVKALYALEGIIDVHRLGKSILYTSRHTYFFTHWYLIENIKDHQKGEIEEYIEDGVQEVYACEMMKAYFTYYPDLVLRVMLYNDCHASSEPFKWLTEQDDLTHDQKKILQQIAKRRQQRRDRDTKIDKKALAKMLSS